MTAIGTPSPMPSSTGNTTLVGCVGFNPASVLIAARHYKPARVILIGTAGTKHHVGALSRQLGIPVQCIAMATANEPIGVIAEHVREKLRDDSNGRILFDVTGGNKLLTLGAWVGIGSAKLATDAVQLVYLTPDGKLIDPTNGRDTNQQAVIKISEVLEWNGAKVKSTGWAGSLSGLPTAMVERRRLGEALLHTLASEKLLIEADRNEATVELPQAIISSLPPGFSMQGKKLRSNVSGYLQLNAWLEELCLLHAASVLREDAATRAGIGVKLIRDSGGSDEADVVLVRGSRVCVIEAKARRTSKGAGDDLQKRIAKTREFFGDHAHVIFVHPAWGKSPPASLIGSSIRNVDLVGGDPKALDIAIKKALS